MVGSSFMLKIVRFLLFCVFFLKVAEDLMEKLSVSKESLVTGAYMDLLLQGQKET